MKEYIIRTVDEFGRISLPKGMRDVIGIAERDKVCVEMSNETITVRKFLNCCIFCGNNDELKEFMGKPVCAQCIEKMACEAVPASV